MYSQRDIHTKRRSESTLSTRFVSEFITKYECDGSLIFGTLKKDEPKITSKMIIKTFDVRNEDYFATLWEISK
jgi:hypothetical protein